MGMKLTQDSQKEAGPADVSRTIIYNVRRMLERQKLQEKRLNWLQRAADHLIARLGSVTFLAFHAVWFSIWIVYNSGWVSGIKPFDPYPFGFLTFVVSLEAIALAILVLMAQNDLQEDSDRRAELDLQINLFTEQQSALTLEKLVVIEKALGISVSPEEATETQHLLEGIDLVDLEQLIERMR